MSSNPLDAQAGAAVPSLFPQGKAVLHGRTAARYGSPSHALTLAGATLVFYAGARAEADGAVRPRWSFRPSSGDAVDLPEVGRAAVKDDGTYHLAVEGELPPLLLVALSVEKLSYAPATGKRAFGLLGVVAPSYGPQGRSAAAIDITLPPQSYCAILGALDLWLVSGRVTDCADSQSGLPGGNVEAYDRDLTQDDLLGSATTDAGGNFTIFFQSAAFKGIPLLPPPWDVIPPHELVGGPDVFFRVEHGGDELISEPASMGRQAGRENVPRCSHHALCVKKIPVPPAQTLTLWSTIGDVEVPDAGGLNDFDADGLTASGKMAFTGNLDFNGQLSQKYLGQPVSFRFVYAEWSGLATPPAYPADFQPLLAANLNLSAKYGSLYTYIGPTPWDYDKTPVLPVPDGAGWIAVDQSLNFVRDDDRLVQVLSASLAPAVGGGGPFDGTDGAGLPVPAGPMRDRPRKFSFVLEIRTPSTSAHQPVPVPIHLNNSPAYLRFDLTELQASECNPLTESGGTVTVHPVFTVAHPYLSSYDISVQRQGGTVLAVQSDGYTGHSPLWTDPDGESGALTAVYADVGPCSYRSYMNAYRRLTNGYGGVGGQHALRTFCVK